MQSSFLMYCVLGALLLFATSVQSQHCGGGGTQSFTVNCGSDGCSNGFWVDGVQRNSLVLTTNCAYTFNVGAGNGFTIGTTARVAVTNGGGITVSNNGATSGAITISFTQKKTLLYYAPNSEARGFITVVQDGAWGNWGCCSNGCGSGSQRSRSCNNPSASNQNDALGNQQTGAPCPTPQPPQTGDSSTSNTPCSSGDCGAWGAWGGCTNTGGSDPYNAAYDCGTGTKYASCPQGNGCCLGAQPTASCTGNSNGGAVCNGGWSGWSCSVGCGGGTQQHTCNNPPKSTNGADCTPVAGNPCNTQACGGSWSAWTCLPCYCTTQQSCSRTCSGTGANNGMYSCDGGPGQTPPQTPTQPMCGSGSFIGGGSYGWSSYSPATCPCVKTFGSCTQTRSCNNPNPECATSVLCPGSNSQLAGAPQCRNDTWSNWGTCNANDCACTVGVDNTRNCALRPGGGVEKQRCQHGEPSAPYGYACNITNPTDVVHYRICNNDPCDGQWGPWASCSKSCGGGVRSRPCFSSFNGGVNCTDLPNGGGVNGFNGVCNTHDCGCKLNLCFALDGSYSIPTTSWTFLKNFTLTLLTLINTGNGTEAGAVQFSDASATYLVQAMTPFLPIIVNKIIGMNQIQGQTAIGTGLQMCRQQLNSNTRDGIPNVILLITDGSSNDGPTPGPVGDAIKANGTEIFVIGVGGDTNYTELYELASFPKEGVHLFNISSYAALQNIADQVTQGLCFGRAQPAAAANFYPFFALLALLPLGFGVFVIRRRKPIKKVPPPPPPRVVEPPPPPPVKTASPKPVTDKPKDWTVPGTRYIGFGQANIKVKWGTEAPPSAPRGHDKYDRWSMMAHPEGMRPAGPGSPKAMDLADDDGMGSPTSKGGSPLAPAGRSKSCCERFFPCCCTPKALNTTKAKAASNDDEDANWQSNPAAQ